MAERLEFLLVESIDEPGVGLTFSLFISEDRLLEVDLRFSLALKTFLRSELASLSFGGLELGVVFLRWGLFLI